MELQVDRSVAFGRGGGGQQVLELFGRRGVEGFGRRRHRRRRRRRHRRRDHRRRRRRRRVELGVLALLVAAQVDLALEGAAAVVAGERLVAGVLARVRDQVRRLAERLAAHGALVRLLTCSPSTDQHINKTLRYETRKIQTTSTARGLIPAITTVESNHDMILSSTTHQTISSLSGYSW